MRIAIVEDQDGLRTGLAALIEKERDLQVAGTFGTMEAALPALLARPPVIVLADIGLPGMNGIEGVRRLRERHPDVLALMLTVHADDERVFEAVCAGASGYLLKDTPPERLVEALRELAAGGAPMTPEIARKVVRMFQRIAPPREMAHRLTEREVDVLQALAEGHSYKTAARALVLSIDTVRFHIRSIYAKLHVHSKSEAVLAALRKGIVR